MNPDCKNCDYRKHLARLCDCHVWGEDCDKLDTDFCEKMQSKSENETKNKH